MRSSEVIVPATSHAARTSCAANAPVPPAIDWACPVTFGPASRLSSFPEAPRVSTARSAAKSIPAWRARTAPSSVAVFDADATSVRFASTCSPPTPSKTSVRISVGSPFRL